MMLHVPSRGSSMRSRMSHVKSGGKNGARPRTITSDNLRRRILGFGSNVQPHNDDVKEKMPYMIHFWQRHNAQQVAASSKVSERNHLQ